MRACIVEGRASLLPVDSDSNNVLHLACQRGDEAAIELLLAGQTTQIIHTPSNIVQYLT
jgi:hypothetical protein